MGQGNCPAPARKVREFKFPYKRRCMRILSLEWTENSIGLETNREQEKRINVILSPTGEESLDSSVVRQRRDSLRMTNKVK